MSSLTDRIRGVVTPQRARVDPCAGPVAAGGHTCPPLQRDDVAAVLGGEWRASTCVVERRKEPDARHGRDSVGTFAACLEGASADAALFTGAPAPSVSNGPALSESKSAPFIFFDLETTGLSGGAGTQAFLVGAGWFDAGGVFVTRQFLLTRYADERPMLDAVAAELARAGTLVSFNGKSFDTPMLETRYLFHRAPWNGRELPHLDVLHPARRFWKRGGVVAGARAFYASDACSLGTLEKQILGVRRPNDVPGFEIPRRYFQFVRTGDARPLVGVLEHNRLDLLSLAALTSRLLHLTRTGPEGAKDAREALALGFVYARAGLQLRACDAFSRAVEMTDRGAVNQVVRIESLRALALAHRRARQHADAAACWRRLVDAPGCPPRVVREATEALAIHHEHRDRDLETAKTFALRGLDVDVDAQPEWTKGARHRLARLDRKLTISEQRTSLLS